VLSCLGLRGANAPLHPLWLRYWWSQYMEWLEGFVIVQSEWSSFSKLPVCFRWTDIDFAQALKISDHTSIYYFLFQLKMAERRLNCLKIATSFCWQRAVSETAESISIEQRILRANLKPWVSLPSWKASLRSTSSCTDRSWLHPGSLQDPLVSCWHDTINRLGFHENILV